MSAFCAIFAINIDKKACVVLLTHAFCRDNRLAGLFYDNLFDSVAATTDKDAVARSCHATSHKII